MKKVLIISASPRKGGNSDTLCDKFALGAKENGNQVEKVRLSEKKIGYCTGCGACDRTHHCVQRDDREELLDQRVNADVIVFATPVYFFSRNGQRKTCINRTVPRYTEIKNKEFYFIRTSAEEDSPDLHRTREAFRGFTDGCLENPIEKGVLYATGVWKKGEINSTPFCQRTYEKGKRSLILYPCFSDNQKASQADAWEAFLN